jgi:hypothetical protein
MDLTKILSISGRPGLYKVISQTKQAFIVESLADHKRFPAFTHEKISSLEEISVFTTGEDRPLKDILKTLFEKLDGKPAIDPKTENKALQAFFLEIIPDYNQEKVYPSDIRKMISWYNILLEHQMLDFTEEKPVEAQEEKVAIEPEVTTETASTVMVTQKPEPHAIPVEEVVSKKKPERKAPKTRRKKEKE